MDDLKLPLVLFLVWDVKRAIEKNLSLQVGVQTFAQRLTYIKTKDKFAPAFLNWWEKRQKQQINDLNIFNAEHRAVVNLIDVGLRGGSIYESLKALESDLIDICESDIQVHAAKLPLLLQIPLIFLVFPAIAMLLLIPTLCQLAF